MENEEVRETWSYSLDDIHSVYFGLPENEMMVSQTGTFGNSRIIRHLSGGSTSVTKWDGECKVKVGEMVSLNTLTGKIASREMNKKEKREAGLRLENG